MGDLTSSTRSSSLSTKALDFKASRLVGGGAVGRSGGGEEGRSGGPDKLPLREGVKSLNGWVNASSLAAASSSGKRESMDLSFDGLAMESVDSSAMEGVPGPEDGLSVVT